MRLTSVLHETSPVADSLTLPWDVRCRSRFTAQLDSGAECGVILPRGTVLRHGDRLLAESGEVVLVQAAPEEVSAVYSEEPLSLLRAAYHLGNRHVALQVEAGRLVYQHDHVLDDMLRELRLTVVVEKAPFEPESGAYRAAHGPAHRHTHGHEHDHSH